MELRSLIERSLEDRVADLEKLVNNAGLGGAQAGARRSAQGSTGAARSDDPSPSQSTISVGKKATVNKQQFTWNGREWVNDAGKPATGLMKQQLMRSQGLDIKGKQRKPGIIQRTKDYLGGKTAGLAQATRSDPKASLLKKAGAVGASAVGGAIGRAIGGSGRKSAQSTPAQEPQSDTLQAQTGKKALPRTTQSEYTALQKRTMAGDANAAKELVDRLSNASAQNYDINNYANSIGAVLKRSNINDRLKSRLTQKARALRTEAYDHINNVLESADLSWQDLGYTVLISESTQDFVLLLPLQEVELEKMKNLAGI